MHSETTDILDMSGAARVQRRRTIRRIDAVKTEQVAIEKLLEEGWTISYDNSGNWAATNYEATI